MAPKPSASKGTVTPLAQLLPLDALQKARQHIDQAICDNTTKLNELQHHFLENKTLMKTISSLPDVISYDIMVPFGKAAFFPGRLIHTNELMVLLGEGYYTERTVKQTLQILRRRSEFIESQMGNLKSQISDLKFEETFASTTASEVADGILEIREEYIEPASECPVRQADVESKHLQKTDSFEKQADMAILHDDKEHMQIMGRISELELAEEAADSSNEDDEDNIESQRDFVDNMSEDEVGFENSQDDARSSDDHWRLGHKGYSDIAKSFDKKKGTEVNFGNVQASSESSSNVWKKSLPDYMNKENTDGLLTIKSPADVIQLELWKKRKFEQGSIEEVISDDAVEQVGTAKERSLMSSISASHGHSEVPKEKLPLLAQKQAFTGSIVERADTVTQAAVMSTETEPKQAKPVSRFKLRQDR